MTRGLLSKTPNRALKLAGTIYFRGRPISQRKALRLSAEYFTNDQVGREVGLQAERGTQLTVKPTSSGTAEWDQLVVFGFRLQDGSIFSCYCNCMNTAFATAGSPRQGSQFQSHHCADMTRSDMLV